MTLRGLKGLFGHRQGVELVVVTPRGVELSLVDAHKLWTVKDFVATLADIEELPELAPDSRRAA